MMKQNQLFIATFSNDAVQLARTYGVGLELNHTCISEMLDLSNRDALLEEIRRDMDASGADTRARELGMQRLNEAYAVAAALGVTRMIVHNGWLPFIYFKSWQAEKGALFWQAFLRDKPADFELCIENVLEDEPDMLVDMMRQIDDPRIRLCLDIGHANAVTAKNLPVTQWIQRLAPYLAHFHLHNNDGSGDTHAAFDAGSMDMQEILQTIDRCCADDVTYTIEAREPLPCLAWLKAHQYL